ncbi:FAD/NAD(P)-binding protein [Microlunatus capsulatus]|uniref:FAD-dependent urate hydroxylase HpyO/Asp monooxygenase CreE-like FAD/NAD(P)-binding domain-containing protein n=1 Tax=Microlunatus capsulatus TaxID=99117 RepID=A0ABS4Z246_9ACTN|nr:FAD/NAD(P)-binding protein [Microlunatus capsulatus]MBP2415117.1 hypothetical protein [Microlunatus capsulatus]
MSGSGGPGGEPVVLVLVGLGPRGAGLLERVVSNAAVESRRPVEVHLVDPFPPGGGRVWRDAQSELLRLNTTAEDLTAFVDASVTMEGPVTPGPSLADWCRTAGAGLADPALVSEAAALGPLDFPTRRLASAYLAAALERTLARLPPSVTVVTHARRAVDLLTTGTGERDLVVLDDGTRLAADAVVLLTSHVDVRPAPPFAALAAFADAHGLTYVPPGYGGDLDLELLRPGQDVLARGFGLGFVDLMVLLTEGRGGKFVEDPDDDAPGRLRYEPSGAEPRLLVGSRRGVPYHAKPMYRLRAAKPERTTFCTPEAVAALLERGQPITFLRDLWPLVALEVTWAYHVELAQGHPERVAVPWPEFAATFARLAPDATALHGWLTAVVPDARDRLDLAALDRPLDGLRVVDREELRRVVRRHVRDDLDRRQDVRFSADLGAFHGLLAVLPVIGPALGSPLMDPRSLVEEFTGWFMGFFSSYASGPPPDRLEQFLALEEAGVVQLVGPGLEVAADPARRVFVGRSSAVPGEVTARALLEATLPAFDLARADDPLLAALAARGEVASQVLTGPDGVRLDTGQLAVDAGHRLRRADGTTSPRRFALGMHTTVKSAAFARPGSNGPVHRHNDQVARALLALEPLTAATSGTPVHRPPDTDQPPRPGGQ